MEKATYFFKIYVLPELLGKCYTHPQKVYAYSFDSAGLGKISDTIFCYCKGPEEGAMIACNNVDCSIEWFHWIV